MSKRKMTSNEKKIISVFPISIIYFFIILQLNIEKILNDELRIIGIMFVYLLFGFINLFGNFNNKHYLILWLLMMLIFSLIILL